MSGRRPVGVTAVAFAQSWLPYFGGETEQGWERGAERKAKGKAVGQQLRQGWDWMLK